MSHIHERQIWWGSDKSWYRLFIFYRCRYHVNIIKINDYTPLSHTSGKYMIKDIVQICKKKHVSCSIACLLVWHYDRTKNITGLLSLILYVISAWSSNELWQTYTIIFGWKIYQCLYSIVLICPPLFSCYSIVNLLWLYEIKQHERILDSEYYRLNTATNTLDLWQNKQRLDY